MPHRLIYISEQLCLLPLLSWTGYTGVSITTAREQHTDRRDKVTHPIPPSTGCLVSGFSWKRFMWGSCIRLLGTLDLSLLAKRDKWHQRWCSWGKWEETSSKWAPECWRWTKFPTSQCVTTPLVVEQVWDILVTGSYSHVWPTQAVWN